MKCPSTYRGHECQVAFPHPSRYHKHERFVEDPAYPHTSVMLWANEHCTDVQPEYPEGALL